MSEDKEKPIDSESDANSILTKKIVDLLHGKKVDDALLSISLALGFSLRDLPYNDVVILLNKHKEKTLYYQKVINDLKTRNIIQNDEMDRG